MIAPASLFLVALTGAADAPCPLARGPAFESSPWVLDVRLRSALLDRARWTAQAATRSTDASPPAPPATPRAAPADPAAGGQCVQCDVDCDTCREAERHARYLFRRRQATLRTHRGFALAAWASLTFTVGLGTVLTINQPTWFGDGRCASGDGIFEEVGCGAVVPRGRDASGMPLPELRETSALATLHQAFAFVTTGLYATAGVIAATAPDPDNAAAGDDPASRALRRHKSLAWVHGVGMILMPLLGVLAANPELFGLDPSTDPEAARDYQRAMRSVHAIAGYATWGAYSLDAVLQLF